MSRPRELPIHMQRNAFDPLPELGEIRRNDGIVRTTSPFGLNTWLVTRYEDVRWVHSDWETFSNTVQADVWAGLEKASAEEKAKRLAGNMIVVDPPDHTRLRRTIAPEFTARRLRRLEPRVVALCEEHLDGLERSGPPADLLRQFAIPVPLLVICELLDVPFADRDYFQRLTAGFLDTSLSSEERMQVQAESLEYIAKFVARNRVEPGDGLLGRMISEHGEEISDAELVGVANLILLAGHETTANMLVLSVLALLRHPDQLDRLRRDPELADTAVEELLRWLSIVHNTTAKVVRRPVQIAGQQVEAGDLVICSLPAANRDPELVERPDELDISRPAPRHVAFGHGPHHCVGAPLARLQLRIALRLLFDRFPGLRLAAEPEFRNGFLTYGLESLPVEW
ncbi:Cytochrome P450 [Saccharopolyspora kobensis]|uniref:Cytochrome P450 n=1 Tax=Saccharopolyspora kobensis TaxID=146035 RepID=A0A1H5ZQY8_9PSEU|nr:cytochrome P450 [Saccharopolyspora kobensis]SEG38612.1 Cytochrome P450 [Saccharopolyspora kobensis]SFE12226.1 Cytochrome P450 [Saccharopolyspora kobensis]